ncbi:hypothetical protein KIH27_15340 [Mycobacterium sp. M1]|uniref:Uncharacterized protein n=1 Tax=Mycolicibacter acidiphilus TaxID=2835306 RepID=A0ABS5RKY5_9MYCO|nr:hypothetical protein [Mycolicibacter acidiphilus]MBS9534963.1 hypothetical protein [Mycolicibacter acidiphilus]
MSTAVTPIARQVAERARHDARFAEVLDALLDAPTAPQGTLEQVAASALNDQRRAALVDDFIAGALPTPAVQQLLRLGTPQAVHRLRSRGKVLGVAIGNQTWFPAWQFDDDRLRADLPRIIDLLDRFTTDTMAADRIMRLTHTELGGSIAEALRRPKTADAGWRLLSALGA